MMEAEDALMEINIVLIMIDIFLGFLSYPLFRQESFQQSSAMIKISN